MNKSEHYGWTELRKRGVERMILISDLLIDSSYQRDEVSDMQTLWKARNFDIDVCGHLLVSHRATDGKYYVIDGQQRLLAARRREDIKSLPCVVRECENSEEEANLFLMANMRRVPVDAYHKWRAAILAGISPHIDIVQALNSIGIRVVKDGVANGTISCHALLVSVWTSDQKWFIPAMRNALVICEGRNITCEMVKGCIYLLKRGVCLDDHSERLRMKGGVSFVFPLMRQLALMDGTKGMTQRICGMGMLSAINKHLRGQKIVLEV